MCGGTLLTDGQVHDRTVYRDTSGGGGGMTSGGEIPYMHLRDLTMERQDAYPLRSTMDVDRVNGEFGGSNSGGTTFNSSEDSGGESVGKCIVGGGEGIVVRATINFATDY